MPDMLIGCLQIDAVMNELKSSVFGNPHSPAPSSLLTDTKVCNLTSLTSLYHSGRFLAGRGEGDRQFITMLCCLVKAYHVLGVSRLKLSESAF
eukprot:scaffold430360_cov22-Prasinocladus_malaysianus.AAC.1